MINRYNFLPCPKCGGDLKPCLYKGIISNLDCDVCGHVEVTSDMTTTEYNRVVEDYVRSLEKEGQ